MYNIETTIPQHSLSTKNNFSSKSQVLLASVSFLLIFLLRERHFVVWGSKHSCHILSLFVFCVRACACGQKTVSHNCCQSVSETAYKQEWKSGEWRKW